MATGRRSAFTLLEITLVLALMVLIGAIVWPALDAPFAAERLKKAADQLRADFTRGRVAAMNSGRTHSFTSYSIRSGSEAPTARYSIIPADEVSADPFSVPVDSAAAAPLPVLERAMPDGVDIREIASLDDVTPPPAMQLQPGNPSMQIYFHPDGTTSSARVTLANDRQMFIDVRLRGLTGGTAIGDVLSAPGAAP